MTATKPQLESRTRACRRLLRSYPRSWRAGGRGEELFWVLYESAEASGRTRPSLGESVNVVGHGIAARLAAAGFLPDSARRHLAELALACATGLSAFLLVSGEVRVRGWSDGVSPRALDQWLRPPSAPFLTLGFFVYVVWFAAVTSYFLNRAQLCREMAAGAACLSLAIPALADMFHRQRPPGGLLVTLAVLGIGASLLPANRGFTRSERITVAAIGLFIFAGLIAWRAYWLTQPTRGGFPRSIRTARTMFYWAPNDNALQINRALSHVAELAAVLCVGLAAIVWYRDRTWIPATLFLIVPAATLRLGTTEFDIHPTPHAGYRVAEISAACLGGLALNGIVVTRLMRKRWRRTGTT